MVRVGDMELSLTIQKRINSQNEPFGQTSNNHYSDARVQD